MNGSTFTASSRRLLRLAEERLGCVLVTDGPHVVGIFTTTDATRILGQLLQSRRSAR